jgi:hypothetical protein
MLRKDERVKEDEDDKACRMTCEAKRGWGVGFSYIKISAIVNRNRLRHFSVDWVFAVVRATAVI